MPYSLVVGTLVFAIAQAPVLPPQPMTDPDAYAIYATLLPEVASQSKDVILLVQETAQTFRCSRFPPVPKGWEGVREDFDRQNAASWTLQAILPTDAYYRVVPKTEIDADDARLEREYPGIWQRRPGSLDFVAFSAVGFNADKTKALLYVQTRSSFQTHLMERTADKWAESREGIRCGGGG